MHISNKNQSKVKANIEKERNEGLQSKNNQSRAEDYQALISENGNFFKFWERDEQAGKRGKEKNLATQTRSVTFLVSHSSWVSLVFLIIVEA